MEYERVSMQSGTVLLDPQCIVTVGPSMAEILYVPLNLHFFMLMPVVRITAIMCWQLSVYDLITSLILIVANLGFVSLIMAVLAEGKGGNRASGTVCILITMVSTIISYISSYKSGRNVPQGKSLALLLRSNANSGTQWYGSQCNC